MTLGERKEKYMKTEHNDQLAECIAKIKAAHEKAEFHNGLVTKHGKDSILAALECGKYLEQARIIVGNGWIKWCEKTFPKLTYKTLSNYCNLYRNWKDLSNKDREACETLNQAYLACKVTPEPKTKRAKASGPRKEPVPIEVKHLQSNEETAKALV